MAPPLERIERREEPKAQGGEFVEVDDCKAYEANKPDEGACLGRKCNVRRISTMAKSSCISGKWSLLSKGLRGGKSRRLRVESLLRWMIASEDAKNPLKARKQKRIQGYGLAISDWKKGIAEWSQGSLRRHKCNVRRIRC